MFLVPPEIDDLKTSSDVHVNEGDEASLECHANGHPKPEIKWLREDKANFTVYDRNNKRMIGKHGRNKKKSFCLCPIAGSVCIVDKVFSRWQMGDPISFILPPQQCLMGVLKSYGAIPLQQDLILRVHLYF